MDNAQFAASGLTLGQINALVKKLGGHKAVLQVLRGELTVSAPVRAWREQDGIIRLSVTSNGRTGEEWITYFESKGTKLTKWAKDLLRSPAFQPTSGVTTEIAVMKGSLFADADRITSKIRAEADKRNFTKPNPEVACLIRDMFTDKEIEEMGLVWIVAMHDPIEDSDRYPSLLGTYRSGGGPWLHANCDKPVSRWDRGSGFAFVVAQVSPYR